ncbi:MAG: hypothetical protein H0V70_30230 [Ktedonobacteraceae bacterium]|nr:hypothetical protein [Ktedonobacteraceae bacterium]
MSAQQSEVATLIACIEAEYNAAMQGLYGYASGTARHEIISARMERTQNASARLIEIIGKDAALPIIVAVMDGSTPS